MNDRPDDPTSGGAASDSEVAPADPSTVPTADPRPAELRRADSLVVVNTGDGKGKSTAAFGIMVRAVARGWPVAVVQFLKSGAWNTGEEKVAKDLGVDFWAIGDGFTWDSDDLSEDEAIAHAAWDRVRDLLAADSHRLLILDEITYPMNWGWISTDDVVAAIAGRNRKLNVVCTGRDAPEALVDVADTVTEMRSVKHAYDSGIRAMKGIDY